MAYKMISSKYLFIPLIDLSVALLFVMKLGYLFILLLTVLNAIAIPQFCRPNDRTLRITRDILQKGRKLLQSVAREAKGAVESLTHSCSRSSVQNKLLTCTGPEILGHEPIEYVLNCDWGMIFFFFFLVHQKREKKD